MSVLGAQYVAAADELVALFESPELERRWQSASALEGWTVGILAGHLARVVSVPRYVVAEPPPTGPPTAADGLSFGRSAERDLVARENATQYAGGSPRSLLARYRDDLAAVTAQFEAQPLDRLVLTKGTRVVALDDYLIGRALELFVHADDLAVSLGLATPPPPEELMTRVLELLVTSARTRHGDVPVLRAFTRRERDDVDALRVI